MDALALTKALISKPSITPTDAGCQTLIQETLAPVGFYAQLFPEQGIDNLWLTHGQGSPVFVFAGHTDVVPPGDLTNWQTPPFEPSEKHGHLYGRGACDMKAALAAFTCAARDFVRAHPDHAGTLALLITSDEEGPAQFGTRYVVQELNKMQQKIDYCLVGEPSASHRLGDTIKIGRRGSLTATLHIQGKQGHVAYPHLTENPIHQASAFLHALVCEKWDKTPHPDFPETSLQIVRLHADSGANNVTPADLQLTCNWRFSPATNESNIRAQLNALLAAHALKADCTWRLSGEPFSTPANSTFVVAVQTQCQTVLGITPTLSTSGGTSDGRFIAAICPEIVELGMINRTIHQANENIPTADIASLYTVYLGILEHLFIGKNS